MHDKLITVTEFTARLASLCLGGVGPGLPRKLRDRRILLKAVAQALGHGRQFQEPELNAALKLWLETVGDTVQLDHVSLRRYLVEERFLVRDRAGSHYQVSDGHEWSEQFEAGVSEVDATVVIREAVLKKVSRRELKSTRS